MKVNFNEPSPTSSSAPPLRFTATCTMWPLAPIRLEPIDYRAKLLALFKRRGAK